MNFHRNLELDNGAEGSDLLTNQLPLSVVIVLIPVICLDCTFFFKNRKLQLKITLVLYSGHFWYLSGLSFITDIL